MKEDDLLKRIRQSAQPAEIPEDIRPENIEKKLGSSSQSKKKHMVRRWAAGVGEDFGLWGGDGGGGGIGGEEENDGKASGETSG